MADFEDLRLLDLLKTVADDIYEIQTTKDVNLFQKAGHDIQSVYNFYVAATKSFSEQEQYLKNLFSSFNYAAVIINDGIKKGEKTLDEEDKELLNECLEIMIRCCSLIDQSINKS